MIYSINLEKNALIFFHINYEFTSAYIAFLIKEIPKLNFPLIRECYENDKSITTYYRLLRNIGNVILYDIDEDKNQPY